MKNKASKLLTIQIFLLLFSVSVFGQDSFSHLYDRIDLSMVPDFPINCLFSGLNKDDEGSFTYEVYNPTKKKIKMRVITPSFNSHFVYEGKKISFGEVIDIDKEHFSLTLHYKELNIYPFPFQGEISVEFMIGKKKKSVVDIRYYSFFKVFTQKNVDSLANDIVVFDLEKISSTPVYICFWTDHSGEIVPIGRTFTLYKNNDFYKNYDFNILELYELNISDLENGEYRIEYEYESFKRLRKCKLHFFVVGNGLG